jgi:hypothetical protein
VRWTTFAAAGGLTEKQGRRDRETEGPRERRNEGPEETAAVNESGCERGLREVLAFVGTNLVGP